MNVSLMPLAQTRQFSTLLLDYLSQKPDLQLFYSHFPEPDNFQKLIENRRFSAEKRETLHKTLLLQYAGFDHFPKSAIESLLDDKTFTVTTGHQLNIFSGPLYVIYKLVTVINLAKSLKIRYPQYNFVPVYWMASEDHDFEEINHFELFGKTYTWKTEQTGAVGEMNPAEIGVLLAEMPEKPGVFAKAYQYKTLAEATRFWVNELLGNENLVCIDASTPELKKQFREVMQADILENKVLPLFERQTQNLEKAGYEKQIQAREINFFYLTKGIRERIVKEEGKYKILNTELAFSETEMQALIENQPEELSPNVVLRPVYQEVILPNLAYIGGPAEVSYWFQLKDIFDFFQVELPALLPRNFALYINQVNKKRMDKLGVSTADLFEDEVNLRKQFVEKNAENPIDVRPEQAEIEKVFNSLIQKALQTDASLEGWVKAERQKAMTSLESIEKRLKKAEEQKQSTQINQLLGLRTKLFPGGGLQERHDNFLSFYLNNPAFLQILLDTFDPFDFRFYILTEDEA
jgi:bacillithiol synthase